MKNHKLLRIITWGGAILTLITNTIVMLNLLTTLPNNGFKEALGHLIWTGDLVWSIGAPIALLYLLTKYWNIDQRIMDTDKAVVKLLAKQKKDLEIELNSIKERMESNDKWAVTNINQLREKK